MEFCQSEKVGTLNVYLLFVSVYSCIILIWDTKQTDVRGGCNFGLLLTTNIHF